MMARYIDAEALKRNIRVNLMPNVDIDGTVSVENAERYFLNLIDKTSTADVVEVKHGVWILEHEVVYDDCDTYLETMYKCSICGRYEHTQEPYCHCGAKMHLEEGAET